ncbi:hypothetical protein COCON_G00184670 [Conger conger]|uniref:Uncharacterized protein n=1 Tax=Conger conger TaxID=82655 RepID=A0A9Q1D2F8_CONCO|nr:hypothetical protein COCON_G00184670 [Conger conger]
MPENVSLLRNRTEFGHSRALGPGARPAWVITVLASVLIFTTVVDVLGNLLTVPVRLLPTLPLTNVA